MLYNSKMLNRFVKIILYNLGDVVKSNIKNKKLPAGPGILGALGT